MNRRKTSAGVVLGLMFLVAFVVNGLHSAQGESPPEEKVTRKIIISGDRAVIDGDTIDLDDLEESIRRTGELDITIVGEEGPEEDEWERRNEVVKFGGDVRIEKNEKISGSVVVFGGSADIEGVVTEDVVVMGGDLNIYEAADIGGSAVCFGGEIVKMPGAKIGDQEVSLGNFPFHFSIGPFLGYDHGVGRYIHRGVGLFAGIVLLGLILLFGAGVVFFFPNVLERVSTSIKISPVKAGLVGLLGEILLMPLFVIVTVILCVSIIGIPLLFLVIPLAVLAVFCAFFLGYIGAGVFAGRKIGERASIPTESAYRVMAIGVIALLAFDILAALVALTGDVLWPVQAIFGIVGGIIMYLAATVGFGAVILTRFGTRYFEPATSAVIAEETPGE